MKVLLAALLGLLFALGLMLLFNGGRWQEPVGFLLLALCGTELFYVLYNISEALGRDRVRDG